MRAFHITALVAGALSAMLLPGTASAGTTSSPNPGVWCSWYAKTQLSKAVGIDFTYVGLAGSMRDNSLACRMAVAGGPAGAPEYRVLVDFQQACSLQYPGTTAAPMGADGWYCTRATRHGYDDSSRPMK
jgi:hypothetical protein